MAKREVYVDKIAVFDFKNSNPDDITNPKGPRDDLRSPKPWLLWGDADSFPSDTWSKVEKSNVASTALAIHMDAHFGNGIIYFKEEFPGEGKRLKTPVENKEVKDFFKRNLIQTQWRHNVIRDYEIYNLAVIEITMESKVSLKVSRVFTHDAQHFRFGVPDDKGKITKGFLSANFPNPAADEYEELPLIDPFNPEESIKNSSSFRFLYVSFVLSPGKFYYPKANWYSVISSGWLDIVISVPEMKKALFENSMTVKYLVEINADYWPKAYRNWAKLTEEEQKKKKILLRQNIHNYLAGQENVGKSIESEFWVDPRTNKETKSIIITAIDDLLKEGKFLPDASAGNDELNYGFQVDPSIIGVNPGKDRSSSGSGSDKRVSWHILQARKPSHRVVTLQALELVARLNGWDVDFGYEDQTFQTLDVNPTGKSNTTN